MVLSISILIKGMGMPTCCFKCGFYHHSVDDGYYDFEYCGANNHEFNNAYDSTKPHINPFEEKLNDCPLVPVQPHGRLIDASESIRVEFYDEEHEDWTRHDMTIDDLLGQSWVDADAPTIIPAEEERA